MVMRAFQCYNNAIIIYIPILLSHISYIDFVWNLCIIIIIIIYYYYYFLFRKREREGVREIESHCELRKTFSCQ